MRPRIPTLPFPLRSWRRRGREGGRTVGGWPLGCIHQQQSVCINCTAMQPNRRLWKSINWIDVAMGWSGWLACWRFFLMKIALWRMEPLLFAFLQVYCCRRRWSLEGNYCCYWEIDSSPGRGGFRWLIFRFMQIALKVYRQSLKNDLCSGCWIYVDHSQKSKERLENY